MFCITYFLIFYWQVELQTSLRAWRYQYNFQGYGGQSLYVLLHQAVKTSVIVIEPGFYQLGIKSVLISLIVPVYQIDWIWCPRHMRLNHSGSGAPVTYDWITVDLVPPSHATGSQWIWCPRHMRLGHSGSGAPVTYDWITVDLVLPSHATGSQWIWCPRHIWLDHSGSGVPVTCDWITVLAHCAVVYFCGIHFYQWSKTLGWRTMSI